MSKTYLSLEECVKASEDLADSITAQVGVKGLVAVLNGGVFPAYWARKALRKQGIELPLLFIDIQSYSSYTKQGALEILSRPALDDGGAGWVFIDEISDTGKTFEAIREVYPKALCYALSAKEKGEAAADFTALSFKQDQWIVFPWEVLEDQAA